MIFPQSIKFTSCNSIAELKEIINPNRINGYKEVIAIYTYLDRKKMRIGKATSEEYGNPKAGIELEITSTKIDYLLKNNQIIIND